MLKYTCIFIFGPAHFFGSEQLFFNNFAELMLKLLLILPLLYNIFIPYSVFIYFIFHLMLEPTGLSLCCLCTEML